MVSYWWWELIFLGIVLKDGISIFDFHLLSLKVNLCSIVTSFQHFKLDCQIKQNKLRLQTKYWLWDVLVNPSMANNLLLTNSQCDWDVVVFSLEHKTLNERMLYDLGVASLHCLCFQKIRISNRPWCIWVKGRCSCDKPRTWVWFTTGAVLASKNENSHQFSFHQSNLYPTNFCTNLRSPRRVLQSL